MPLTMNETQTVTVWTVLVLVIALLFLAGGVGCANVSRETDVAVALPPDWEFRLGVSVADTPQMRPGYFAVHKDWLKEQM